MDAKNGTNDTNENIDWEKRAKDNQKAFTQSQQNLSKIKKELDTAKNVIDSLKPLAVVTRTPEQVEELEILKLEDPDKWHKRLLELERSEKSIIDNTISTATAQSELELREQTWNSFKQTSKVLNDDTIEDIPVRITKRLEKGEITFEDYLVEAEDYLKKITPKVFTDGTNISPNLHSATGSNTPSDANNKHTEVAYEQTIL